jgi:hypothetical protein
VQWRTPWIQEITAVNPYLRSGHYIATIYAFYYFIMKRLFSVQQWHGSMLKSFRSYMMVSSCPWLKDCRHNNFL